MLAFMPAPIRFALPVTLLLALAACAPPLAAVIQAPLSTTQGSGGPPSTCLFSPSAYDFRIQCQATQQFYLRFKTQNGFLDLRQNMPATLRFFYAKNDSFFDTDKGDKLSFRQDSKLVPDYTALAFPLYLSDERFGQDMRMEAQVPGFKPVSKNITATKSETRLLFIPELVIELEAL